MVAQSGGERAARLAALLALPLVFGWQAAQVYLGFDGNWTALFYHDSNPPLPQGFEETYLHPVGGDYDGQYYRYLARDPVPPFAYAKWFDAPAQRGSRILLPGLAWALSFGGRAAPDAIYILLVDLFAAAGVYCAGRWLAAMGRSAWLGLCFLLLPGVVSSVDRLLIDVALAACVAGFYMAAETGNRRLMLACAMAAPLARETGFALPVALLLTGNARSGLAAFLPGAAWTAAVLAMYPLQARPRELGFLPVEWVRRLLEPRPHPEPAAEALLRSLDVAALLGLAILFFWTLRHALPRIADPQAMAALLFLAGGFFLGGINVMSDPYHWGRVQSPWMLWILMRALVGGRWPPLLALGAVTLTPLAHSARRLLD